MTPILDQAAELNAGRTTSHALTEAALAKIKDPAGEGGRVFVGVSEATALAAADASDRMREAGMVPSPIAGLPISVKDLFDVAGEVTSAGSVVMKGNAPAVADSVVVRRLRQAGAVIVGRTNLTEFAYSGLGINPHYGTPKNPWDRATGRIPGGSSSGAAVSVTDGMAAAAIGTDTGGSVRIPAALCGLTGLKTTTGRISLDGVFPLASSLDSVGPLAPTVTCCAVLDAIMRGATPDVPPAWPLSGLRFAVPRTYVLDDLDKDVAAGFEAAMSTLSAAGARIVEVPFEALEAMPKLLRHGGVLGAEAYALHREWLETMGDGYDPRVKVRIERGQHLSAADLIGIQTRRSEMMAQANATTAPFDGVLMPTTPAVAPPISDLVESEELYAAANPLMLRNTTVGNLLDRCALTLPCHEPGSAPVGLMLMDETGNDAHLISIALAVEAALRAAGL